MLNDVTPTGSVELNGEHIPYTVERSLRRRRTLGIYLTTTGAIRVVVPIRASLRTIEKTLYRCRGWIHRRRLAQQNEPSLPKIDELNHGDSLAYLGKTYVMNVTRDVNIAQGCRLLNDSLTVNLPDDLPDDELRAAAQLEIMLWYKREAKKILGDRMAYWSLKLNLRYNRLSITSPKSRWGSCSRTNDIRLNWRVIFRSMELIDYLIVHELCHIPQKNHSHLFWDLVGQAIPDYKERRKQLRSVM